MIALTKESVKRVSVFVEEMFLFGFMSERVKNGLRIFQFYGIPSFMKWIPLIIMVLYFFSPLDLIPDVFFPAGFLDDLLVILVVLSGSPFLKKIITGYLEKFRGCPPPEDEIPFEQEEAFRENSEKSEKKEKPSLKTPWEILGVSEDAGADEIKEAYRKRCAEYHPDKVAHLGIALQKVANEEFKKIQSAYEFVKKVKSIQ